MEKRMRGMNCSREEDRSTIVRHGSNLPTIKRARPCSSMSGTKFSIGLGGRGVNALCGRATSCGQSSAEGTPTTLWNDNDHQGFHQ